MDQLYDNFVKSKQMISFPYPRTMSGHTSSYSVSLPRPPTIPSIKPADILNIKPEIWLTLKFGFPLLLEIGRDPQGEKILKHIIHVLYNLSRFTGGPGQFMNLATGLMTFKHIPLNKVMKFLPELSQVDENTFQKLIKQRKIPRKYTFDKVDFILGCLGVNYNPGYVYIPPNLYNISLPIMTNYYELTKHRANYIYSLDNDQMTDVDLKKVKIIGSLSPSNFEAMKKKFGIPQEIDSMSVFAYIIKDYDRILYAVRRPKPLSDYNWLNLNPANFSDIIREYPLVMLTSFFGKEIIAQFLGRPVLSIGVYSLFYNDLAQQIIKVIGDGPKWESYDGGKCDDDGILDPILYEPKNAKESKDPNDPVIQYHFLSYKRCYKISELEGFFREVDGVFMFADPDWIDPDKPLPEDYPFDKPLTNPFSNDPLSQEFEIENIKRLEKFLNGDPKLHNLPSVKTLISKINIGLNQKLSSRLILTQLKREYTIMSTQRQALVRMYLAWLFVYSMILRYWPGLGKNANWQYTTNGGVDNDTRLAYSRIYAYMNEYILNIQKDPYIRRWLETLPFVKYDYSTQEFGLSLKAKDKVTNKIVDSNIKYYVDRTINGTWCMEHGSDVLGPMAYFYITHFLGYRGKRFDDPFLKYALPNLYDFEKVAVDNLLSDYYQNPATEVAIDKFTGMPVNTDFDLKTKSILEVRQQELRKAYITQKHKFNPELMKKTGHIDVRKFQVEQEFET